MTTKQAIAETKKLFGSHAGVQQRHSPANPTHMVGVIAMGMMFDVKGYGSSWEEAVQGAKDYVAREKRRYSK